MFTLADSSKEVLIIEREGWSGAARGRACFAKPERDDRVSSLGLIAKNATNGRMAPNVRRGPDNDGADRHAPRKPIALVSGRATSRGAARGFYTGRDPWRAARSLRDLAFKESAHLLTYFAPACYLLVDVCRMPLETLPRRNRVSLMIRMTRAERHPKLIGALRSEQAWLAEEDAVLWRDYITWATKVLAPLQFPDMDVEQLKSLQEGIEMINEGVVRQLEGSRQAGLAEGLSEGLSKGQRSLLRRQIVWKFGDATAERCADELAGLGDNGRMEDLGRLVLDCRTGEEFLARL